VSQPSLLPVRFFRLFLETLGTELGQPTLGPVLEKGDLQLDLTDPQAASRFTSASAAEMYARIQHALRVYYGRGARGTLVRIGRILWGRLLDNASFPEKATAQIVRSLPRAAQLKPTLELLARFLSEKPGAVTIHTLDMDFMLADHAAAAALGQKEQAPVCSVTLGLIEEALFWATGREYDVTEVSCRAAGSEDACEFKITVSG
jgi:predicted hydrocarbon binding protein